jgi:hypothetical protein
MTRIEIIAQITAEISLLQRARDILAAPPTKEVPRGKAQKRVPLGKRKQSTIVAVPGASGSQQTVAPPSPKPEQEPQIQRLPPKRRVERRQLQRPGSSEKAALSGLVPFGPIAVSADEARKVQERSAPPPPPVENEIRSNSSTERSLGSLVQAFERSSGMSATGTPLSK